MKAGEMMRTIDVEGWSDAKNQRNAHGDPTLLALAVEALVDNGCDCETDKEGTCLACRCEAALRDLWERVESYRAVRR